MKSNTCPRWHLIACTALALVAGPASAAPPARLAYSFDVIATLGDAAPGGTQFTNDFEPNGINNRGDILFGADVNFSSSGEGVYLWNKGEPKPRLLARSCDFSGAIYPPESCGDGSFSNAGFLGPITLNAQGDAAFGFFLGHNTSQFPFPTPFRSGAYRYSHATQMVAPVVLPGNAAPGGGTFLGVGYSISMNDAGSLVFPAFTDKTGQRQGLFMADGRNNLSSIVLPGDLAPRGGAFDSAYLPSINGHGDIAFTAHLEGEECVDIPPPNASVVCVGSLYLKSAATGKVQSLVHQGETPVPGGGVFRQAGVPVMNNLGDIAFLGDLTPSPAVNENMGIFLYSGGRIIPVMRPGDPIKGGGTFVTASLVWGGQFHLNNRREVIFNAVIEDADGQQKTAVFLWSNGNSQLVAKTGTDIGHGKIIKQLVFGGDFAPAGLNSGVTNNDHGQVLFGATLEGDTGVLLLATPQ